MRRILLLSVVLAGCHRAPPPGNPEFNDAVRALFVNFEGEPVDVAFTMRALETAIDASMDVSSGNSNDRALAPERLTEADVAGLVHPRDPALALPVAVAGLSPFPVFDQQHVQMLTDQRPVEPYSPDFFERTFLSGDDCWLDAGCERLETSNDLIKENTLMKIPYVFKKNFRWIDLNLPDPVDVPEGEEAVNPGEPRWAIIARSWTEESFEGENENTAIEQSFTAEVWLPRGESTVRMLSVWSEMRFDGINFTDDQVAGTTRVGIDKNFEAANDWLEENAP